jgi:hypothetical protein
VVILNDFKLFRMNTCVGVHFKGLKVTGDFPTLEKPTATPEKENAANRLPHAGLRIDVPREIIGKIWFWLKGETQREK